MKKRFFSSHDFLSGILYITPCVGQVSSAVSKLRTKKTLMTEGEDRDGEETQYVTKWICSINRLHIDYTSKKSPVRRGFSFA